MKYFSMNLISMIAAFLMITGAAADTKNNPTAKAVPLSKAAGHKIEPLAKGEKLLWDSWYTVTVAGAGTGKTHYGYYNDRITVLDGKVRFKNEYWKLEEGFINEEKLGAWAEATEDFKPVLFNFKSNYRSTEINIDASVSGRTMTIKVRKGDQALEPIHKSLSDKQFTASFFPLWVAPRLQSLSPGKSLSFLTLMEDNVELGFGNVTGRVTADQPDELSQRTHTKKITVDLLDRKSTWWIELNGNAVRIEFPSQHAVVERVDRDTALSFLNQ